MGPQIPEQLKKLAPKPMVNKVNELIDYAVATHIENLQFDADKNDVQETDGGLLIKIKK